MGLIVLRWPAGEAAIQWLADKISGFLYYGQSGARFLFGASYEEHGFAMSVSTMRGVRSVPATRVFVDKVTYSRSHDKV